MTELKFGGKLTASATAAVESHVNAIYRKPGGRWVFIGELRHAERMEPAPETDKEPTVTCQITALEIATDEQEPVIRDAQRALYLQRTAAGTLDEFNQITLSDSTLRLSGGELNAIEAAQLRVVISHWQAYAERLLGTVKLTNSELRHELSTVADGLRAALNGGG